MKEQTLAELTSNMLERIEKIEIALQNIVKLNKIDNLSKTNEEISIYKKECIFELTSLFGTKATGYKGEIK